MARKPNPELIDDSAPELRGGGFPRSRRAAPARHRRGRAVRGTTRRSPIKLKARSHGAVCPGQVFIPF
jgi:hypothetical protein